MVSECQSWSISFRSGDWGVSATVEMVECQLEVPSVSVINRHLTRFTYINLGSRDTMQGHWGNHVVLPPVYLLWLCWGRGFNCWKGLSTHIRLMVCSFTRPGTEHGTVGPLLATLRAESTSAAMICSIWCSWQELPLGKDSCWDQWLRCHPVLHT